MILIPKKQFSKHYKRLDHKIQIKVDEALNLFMIKPLDSKLNNHQLSGKLSHIRSIDATGDYRIWIYQIEPNKYEIVELIDVGTHSQLYG